MSKILLVEDDNNLREIYEARLQAEGYDIVSARDGEEALTVAMKERPDLIISDVMMPKISGFDMLDIIRSTEETRDVKVIMMTALSQAEDKERADKLGADRYLVKSQVTLEDVAKVAREVLNGDSSEKPSSLNSLDTQENNGNQAAPAPATAEPTEQTPTSVPTPLAASPSLDPALMPSPIQDSDTQQGTPVALPADDQPQDESPAMAAVGSDSSDDAQTLSQSSDQELADVTAQIDSFIDSSSPTPVKQEPEPAVNATPSEVHQPPAASVTPEDTSVAQKSTSGKRVIQPLNDPTASKGPDLDKLLEKEDEKNQMAAIAQDIASKSTHDVVAKEETIIDDEASAEETLRAAAENKLHALETASDAPENTSPAPETNQEDDEHAPEVAISEDGNLHLASEPDVLPATPEPATAMTPATEIETPQTAPVPEPTPEPLVQTQDDQSALATAAEELTQMAQQQAQPNIPHTNGTSIDGVSGPSPNPPQPQPQPQNSPAVAPQPQNPLTQTKSADDIAL